MAFLTSPILFFFFLALWSVFIIPIYHAVQVYFGGTVGAAAGVLFLSYMLVCVTMKLVRKWARYNIGDPRVNIDFAAMYSITMFLCAFDIISLLNRCRHPSLSFLWVLQQIQVGPPTRNPFIDPAWMTSYMIASVILVLVFNCLILWKAAHRRRWISYAVAVYFIFVYRYAVFHITHREEMYTNPLIKMVPVYLVQAQTIVAAVTITHVAHLSKHFEPQIVVIPYANPLRNIKYHFVTGLQIVNIGLISIKALSYFSLPNKAISKSIQDADPGMMFNPDNLTWWYPFVQHCLNAILDVPILCVIIWYRLFRVYNTPFWLWDLALFQAVSLGMTAIASQGQLMTDWEIMEKLHNPAFWTVNWTPACIALLLLLFFYYGQTQEVEVAYDPDLDFDPDYPDLSDSEDSFLDEETVEEEKEEKQQQEKGRGTGKKRSTSPRKKGRGRKKHR